MRPTPWLHFQETAPTSPHSNIQWCGVFWRTLASTKGRTKLWSSCSNEHSQLRQVHSLKKLSMETNEARRSLVGSWLFRRLRLPPPKEVRSRHLSKVSNSPQRTGQCASRRLSVTSRASLSKCLSGRPSRLKSYAPVPPHGNPFHLTQAIFTRRTACTLRSPHT